MIGGPCLQPGQSRSCKTSKRNLGPNFQFCFALPSGVLNLPTLPKTLWGKRFSRPSDSKVLSTAATFEAG